MTTQGTQQASPDQRLIGTGAASVLVGAALTLVAGLTGRPDPTSSSWVWTMVPAIIALVTATAALVSALSLRTATQRTLHQLVAEAKRLDREPLAPGQRPRPLTGAAEELSIAMRLSAAELHRQLHRERSFSSDAAHQLRNPLAALGLRLEELVMEQDTPRQLRCELHAGLEEVHRLTGITTDLLTLARTGVLPSMSRKTDLAVAAVHARRRWEPVAASAGRELHLRHPLLPTSVAAAAAPVAQILDVLIDNALKHGTGTIEIGLEVVDGYSRLRVADEGRMAPSHQTSQPRCPSQGIGLPLAEKLADALGGQVQQGHYPTTAYDLLLPSLVEHDATDRTRSPRATTKDPTGSGRPTKVAALLS